MSPITSANSYEPIYITNLPELQSTKWPEPPKLHLRVYDLASLGSDIFFRVVNPSSFLREAVHDAVKFLYTADTCPTSVRSISLILKPMDGVAHTNGSDLDNEHKEIHFSTKHIQNVTGSGEDGEKKARKEIYGVLVHEIVHCYQYDGFGTCPGGLVEGIADWVRLKAGYAPPHWKRGGTKWDEGYQNTAYFLDWIDTEFLANHNPPVDIGKMGFVARLNGIMKDKQWSEQLFEDLTGKSVHDLWELYKAAKPFPESKNNE